METFGGMSRTRIAMNANQLYKELEKICKAFIETISPHKIVGQASKVKSRSDPYDVQCIIPFTIQGPEVFEVVGEHVPESPMGLFFYMRHKSGQELGRINGTVSHLDDVDAWVKRLYDAVIIDSYT